MDDFKMPTLPSAVPKVEKKSTNDEEENIIKPDVPTTTVLENQTPNTCPYKVPSWSATPKNENIIYKFEVLKSGQIIEEIDNLQAKENWKFGRLPEFNDIVMAHPTISRYHAVLQYRPNMENSNEEGNNYPEGWYIFDLGSTHGTFLNKQKLPPKVYIRVRVGHMLRLGASSRSFILHGPTEDEEPESELSVTELREQRQRQQQEAAEAKIQAELAEEERKKNEGISWGMEEEANEETDLSYNPYASSNNEDYFAANPKMALRHFFEREDMPLEYKCDEMSMGSFVCRIELPVDDENGRPITAEVVHKGKKKDCVLQCALEACRILDRLGVLRQKNQEPLARHKKPQSDSDEDEFLDRTGDIARRKERKANANTNVTLTYEDLLKQEKDLTAEMEKVDADIAEYQAKQKRLKEQSEAQKEADLDSFMEHLNEDVSQLDKTEIKKLRLEQTRLKMEQSKLKRLIKLAKPYELPFAMTTTTENDNSKAENLVAQKKQLPMIGKRNQFSKFKVIKPSTTKAPSTSKTYASDEEEMDEEDDKVVTNKQTKNDEPLVELSKVDQKVEEDTKHECEKVRKIAQQKYINKEQIEVESTVESNVNSAFAVGANSTFENKNSPSATQQSGSESTIEETPVVEDTSDNSRKRQRPRQRVRGKRQDVDNDDLDEHESSEKYAKWVPPANQTGDGFTALNDKYGY